jgi:hypothetical protein
MEAAGSYYDGKSSDRVPVVATLAPGLLEIRGGGIDLSFPLGSVTVMEGVGGSRGILRLPGGGMCVFDDGAFLERVAGAQGGKAGPSLLRRWERSLACAAAALLIAAAVVAAAVRYGVPVLAKRVAFLLPAGVEARLGEESLEVLDRFAFKPSGLPAGRRDGIREIFRDVGRETSIDGRSRIVFRKGGPLGANAVALPAGIVVVTDELVSLAANDGEIAAVLAHEAGHVRGRHGLRHLLQNSLTVLLVSAATGDIASISSLAAAAPTLLIDAKYSRDFEREADAAALRYLAARNIPPRAYADILRRLQAQLDGKKGGEEPSFTNYLSSHPPTEERIRAISGGR